MLTTCLRMCGCSSQNVGRRIQCRREYIQNYNILCVHVCIHTCIDSFALIRIDTHTHTQLLHHLYILSHWSTTSSLDIYTRRQLSECSYMSSYEKIKQHTHTHTLIEYMHVTLRKKKTNEKREFKTRSSTVKNK